MRPTRTDAESTERESGSKLLPVVLATLPSAHDANELAARLRREGAVVAVIEEQAGAPVTCDRHPPQLLGRTCGRCGDGICAVCRAEAGGKRLCSVCAGLERKANRNRRLRQLFAIFLFSVFLYQVVDFRRAEQAHVDPTSTIHVGLYQFVPASAKNHPLVLALNDPGSPNFVGALEGWYTAERRRYTGNERPALMIERTGPWVADVQPPGLASEADSAWKQAWQAWRYPRYFHSLAIEHGGRPDSVDARVHVVYGEAADLASHSLGSATGRIAVAYVNLADPNAAYAQITIAHELAHILGAEDLYDPSSYLARAPEGLAEPRLVPPYPQRYAELMAVDRPLAPTSEEEVRALSEVRIGPYTAGKLGWITPTAAKAQLRPLEEVCYGPEPAEPVVAATAEGGNEAAVPEPEAHAGSQAPVGTESQQEAAPAPAR